MNFGCCIKMNKNRIPWFVYPYRPAVYLSCIIFNVQTDEHYCFCFSHFQFDVCKKDGKGATKDWETWATLKKINTFLEQVNRLDKDRCVSWFCMEGTSPKGSAVHKQGWCSFCEQLCKQVVQKNQKIYWRRIARKLGITFSTVNNNNKRFRESGERHVSSKAENQHWLPVTFDPSCSSALTTGTIVERKSLCRLLDTLSVSTVCHFICMCKLKLCSAKQKAHVNITQKHRQLLRQLFLERVAGITFKRSEYLGGKKRFISLNIPYLVFAVYWIKYWMKRICKLLNSCFVQWSNFIGMEIFFLTVTFDLNGGSILPLNKTLQLHFSSTGKCFINVYIVSKLRNIISTH